MFKRIVSLIEEFDKNLKYNYVDNFRIVFYLTFIIQLFTYIIGKTIPILYPSNLGINSIAENYDSLLYWINFTWLLIILYLPFKKIMFRRISKNEI